MEREVLVRGAMVLSILVLVVLILVTPVLVGRPPSELESVPLLVVGMPRDESVFIVGVEGALQAYRYDEIRVAINGTQPWNDSAIPVNRKEVRNESYSIQTWVPSNATFTVHVYFLDQQGNYFEYNVTAHAEKNSENRTVMVFQFPDEDNPGMEVTRSPPDDFRWGIPRRGRAP